ncbi:MAG: T9SS type A sorting domain-containing protein [Calditrichia bacterium]
MISIIFLLSPALFAKSNASENFLFVIIDGARYSETFGDPNHTYVPQMWNLAQQGTYAANFYNDSLTYTAAAIPALWCGTWTDVRDTVYQSIHTNYAVKPSLFEYYRKQKNMPADQCFYVLKSLSSLWLPSFDAEYGPDYWPQFHSLGHSDAEVATEAQKVMDSYHPRFLWVYLADVDSKGHSGDWSAYTHAILEADSIVGLLWNRVQTDPFYRNSTTLFVTNDHGRHDDQHGGFSGHGCGCEGCRHIMFLALGAGIRQNYVSSQYHRIPDMAVTAAAMLDVNPGKASGEVMNEMLDPSGIAENNTDFLPASVALAQNYPNPFNNSTRIKYQLSAPGSVRLEIFNCVGQQVALLFDGWQSAGMHTAEWSGDHAVSGIYFYQLSSPNTILRRKCLLLK